MNTAPAKMLPATKDNVFISALSTSRKNNTSIMWALISLQYNNNSIKNECMNWTNKTAAIVHTKIANFSMHIQKFEDLRFILQIEWNWMILIFVTNKNIEMYACYY